MTDVTLQTSAKIILLQKLQSHTSVTLSGILKDIVILNAECVTTV